MIPQGPTASHPPPTYHGWGSADAPGSADGQLPPNYPNWAAPAGQYTPPPPPPPLSGDVQHGGGFGDHDNTAKMWRNGLLAVVALLVVLWLLIWVVPPRLVGLVPISVDVAIGEQSWHDLAPPSDQCTDPGPLAYVEQLAQPLVDAADSEFEFQFVVVESEEINAFALPGGFVTVNMGLLEAAETGEEIAAVIGHEMTHVTHRHGMRAVLRRVGGVAVIALVFGGTGIETLAYGAEMLVGQAHSRDQERDADEGGRALLMAAGIDPIGMATFFERLEQEYAAMPESMRHGFALLSTHPDPGERAATTREISAGFTATLDLPDPPENLRCHPE